MFQGAVVYYDGQQNDARMNVMIVLSAVREGATASNYIEVSAQSFNFPPVCN